MKHIFSILAVLALALAAPAVMQGQASKAEQEIRRVEDEIIQAHLKADVAKLDKCYADEFTVIRPNGAVTGKAELLEAFRSGTLKYGSLEVSDHKVHIYGNAAIVDGVWKATGIYFGNPIPPFPTRNTAVYIKRNGRWQVLRTQLSSMMPPPMSASEAEQQVRELHNTLNRARLKADVAVLDKGLADEFILIQPNGTVVGKAELLEAIRGGKIKDYSIEESDPKIRVYGDTAVMTTVEKTTGEQFGMPSSGLFRNGMAYAKRGGKWVAVLHQMSPIVTPPQPNAAPGK